MYVVVTKFFPHAQPQTHRTVQKLTPHSPAPGFLLVTTDHPHLSNNILFSWSRLHSLCGTLEPWPPTSITQDSGRTFQKWRFALLWDRMILRGLLKNTHVMIISVTTAAIHVRLVRKTGKQRHAFWWKGATKSDLFRRRWFTICWIVGREAPVTLIYD